MMNVLQAWWSGADARERRIVAMGGGIAGLILMVNFIVSPMLNHVEQLKNNVRYQQTLLQWMQPQVKNLLHLRQNRPAAGSSQTALTVVERELKQGVLSGYSPVIKQGQQDQVQVDLSSVPFDEVIRWLGMMHQHHGITVVSLRVAKIDIASIGMVKASLVLAR